MIQGERVRLRAVEREDLPRFVAWFNDPEVRRGLTSHLPMSQADEEKWYEGQLRQPPAERALAIDVLDGEQWVHAGSCGFLGINWKDRRGEVGISIGDKRYWGKGYGTEVMRLLLQHGFETLNLNRIYLRVFAYNEGAIKVYRRVGFQEEGRLREDHYFEGRYWDTLIMGILRRDWQAAREGEG